MKTSSKFILGGIFGLFFTSFLTSGYFYTFFRKIIKKIKEDFTNFDDLN